VIDGVWGMGVYGLMHSFQEYLAQGHAWLYVPAAVLLGALHGLEPGHSKTMMAAFIVAIRGTVAQAVLLGVAATVSHTAIIWVLAFVGLHYAGRLNVEHTEPYFQLAAGLIVIGMAGWMFARTRREQRRAEEAGHHHEHSNLEGHPHHDREHESLGGHEPGSREYQDAHQREHALELSKRFAGGQVTTGQLVLFGLTGGLLPCPSAFAVLVVCLQLKQFSLGFALVLAFSVGLAVTLVTVGAVAALSVRQASKRFKGFTEFARKMPYVSSAVMCLIGLLIAGQGLRGIMR
jgi:nickel/cobalt transporter (NicO) family protein